MLKIQKLFMAGLAIAVLGAATGQVAQAVPTPIAIAGDNTPAWNVNWTGGVGGAWTLTVPSGFLRSKIGPAFNPNVKITITPLVGTGAAGYFWLPVYGGFDQILGGGMFTITDNATGAVLLSGNFNNAILHGTNGSSSASVTLMNDSVLYTNPINAFFPTTLNPQGGSLSIEFVTQRPIIAGPGGANPFIANDGITFKTQ